MYYLNDKINKICLATDILVGFGLVTFLGDGGSALLARVLSRDWRATE